MTEKLFLLSLSACVLALGLACGGGGGGGGAGSPSSSAIRFSGKEGDGLKVYGLEGTYSDPSPLYFSGNFIPTSGGKGELDVELEKGNYRIRYVDRGLEIMEFIVAETDFPEDGSADRRVNMGEMNGITTYLSSLYFKGTSNPGKPRSNTSPEVLASIEEFLSARGMTSFQNASRGSIEVYLQTAEERTWANLTMINLRRVTNLLSTGTFEQSQWDSLVNTITDMAVEDEAGRDPNVYASTYLSLSSDLPDMTTEEAEEVIVGLSASGNQFGLILDMAQAETVNNFESFQEQYLEDKVIEGIYAFVDLTDGSVTYDDELDLDPSQKDSVMVFRKIPASTNYPYVVDGDDTAISLSEYYMAMYEVTWDQYGQIVEAEGSGDKPVHSISHASALSYASSLGAILSEGQVNLPTDAQWEVAARGAGVTSADSSTAAYLTWNCFDTDGITNKSVSVGSLDNDNVFGLFDMNGNVAEFCLDRLTAVEEGTVDPVGNTSLISIRGGGWLNIKEHCTVGHKEVSYDTELPPSPNSVTGFRLIFTKNN